MGTLMTRVAGIPVVLERKVKTWDAVSLPFVTWYDLVGTEVYGLGSSTTRKDDAEAMAGLEWAPLFGIVGREYDGHSARNGGMVKPQEYYDFMELDPMTATIGELEAALDGLFSDWRNLR